MLFHTFQRGMETLPLYEFVRSEVEDLQEFYERKVERSTNRLLYFLTFFGLPIGILAELYSNALIPKATWTEAGIRTAEVLSACGTLYLLYTYWYKLKELGSWLLRKAMYGRK